MARGVDYTAGRLSAAQLRSAGMSFAGRYIGRTTRLAAKFADVGETIDFQNGGIGLVLFFEDGAQRSLAGGAAGQADARLADVRCDSLLEYGHPVLFTVDFAASKTQLQGPIKEYFEAAREVLGVSRMGCYGSYDTVRTLLDLGLVTYACQTSAWSRGRRDVRAQLYQGDVNTGRPAQTTVAGITCDVLTALADDYGQGAEMGLSADDRTWLDSRMKWWSIRGPAAMITGHSNRGYAPDEVDSTEAMPAQLAVLAGQVAGLNTAISALSAPAGLDMEKVLAQVKQAAHDGTSAALHAAATAAATAAGGVL